MKPLKKADPILKYILDQETENFKKIVYFGQNSEEQTEDLMRLIRGFAVTVALRFEKIQFIINLVLFTLATTLAYIIVQHQR